MSWRDNIIPSLLVGAILAAAGALWSQNDRVTRLEAKDEAIETLRASVAALEGDLDELEDELHDGVVWRAKWEARWPEHARTLAELDLP